MKLAQLAALNFSDLWGARVHMCVFVRACVCACMLVCVVYACVRVCACILAHMQVQSPHSQLICACY